MAIRLGGAAAAPDLETVPAPAGALHDPDAVADAITTSYDRLVAAARRIVRDDDEARDVVQEACLHALRGLDGFAGRARLTTWLHRIVVNTALMRLRSRRHRREEPLDNCDGVVAGTWPTTSEAAEEAASRREQLVLVGRALASLPVRHRTVLELRQLADVDTDEAARTLGIRTNALRIRLHRARRALRGRLAVLDAQAGAAVPVRPVA